MKNNHTAKYTLINGSLIEMRFSKKQNGDLFPKIREILINSNSHICKKKETALHSDPEKYKRK